ncbi:hypothetical protein DUNSADRAFT_9763 [Dunaliella salina]|uniref:Tubulin-folding cofactor D C-terminal domain-containing protein n=1 Tax=Dunaliella salina TaxID=3046 RepID=A0ABQ7GGU8_DUNSA|nr:hypothetical protein DUNSADRAFT_9763 [Dunaliella salina]|eukprot:KAF5833816.1 hypothetical protein DUNSADRAFT_9763 [Dunaliella salina]
MDAYLTRLHDPNVAVRRGYASAVGAMPGRLLQGRAEEVIDALVDGTILEEDPDDRDVEARVKCVRALGSVCSTLYSPSSACAEPEAGQPSGLHMILQKVLPCIHANLEDYTTDNRGDVGSWVREAAMDVLEALTLLVGERVQQDCPNTAQQGEILSGVVPAATGALLKQAVERIARMRDLAARRLHGLVSSPHVACAMPAAGQLAAALPQDDGTAEVVSLQSIKRLSGLLLAAPQYARPVLEGLVASIGGVDAQLAKVASEALLSLTLSPTSVVQHADRNKPSKPSPNQVNPPTNTTSDASTANNAAMGSSNSSTTTTMPSSHSRGAEPGCTASSNAAAADKQAPPAVVVASQLLAIWRDNSTNTRLLPSLGQHQGATREHHSGPACGPASGRKMAALFQGHPQGATSPGLFSGPASGCNIARPIFRTCIRVQHCPACFQARTLGQHQGTNTGLHDERHRCTAAGLSLCSF